MTESASVFFEGTEKKIELLTAPSGSSLRELGENYWAQVVESCGAQILSKLSGDQGDAYLLSESSLFVFDHRMLMITCGQTRLVDSLPILLRRIPKETIIGLIYERKNEVFPHGQPSSFFEDVRALETQFSGRAYRFGDEDEHHLFLYHLDQMASVEDDATLELLMYGLDPEAAAHFGPLGSSGKDGATRSAAGLDDILPGFVCDDHLFTPAGYSLNGLDGGRYWTLHVTPNELHSYASFETNAVDGSRLGLAKLVEKVVACFRPRAFDLVMFQAADDAELDFAGYQRKGRVKEALSCGYDVGFVSYFRPRPGVSRPVRLPLL